MTDGHIAIQTQAAQALVCLPLAPSPGAAGMEWPQAEQLMRARQQLALGLAHHGMRADAAWLLRWRRGADGGVTTDLCLPLAHALPHALSDASGQAGVLQPGWLPQGEIASLRWPARQALGPGWQALHQAIQTRHIAACDMAWLLPLSEQEVLLCQALLKIAAAAPDAELASEDQAACNPAPHPGQVANSPAGVLQDLPDEWRAGD
ncbi:hypothetical protein V8J88_03160 [Massilia sp. W12]|uniref:hypothetical protein n=1 Tax=Massilia sp. W12 TaxID=3126507 RepID=UPI0030D39116